MPLVLQEYNKYVTLRTTKVELEQYLSLKNKFQVNRLHSFPLFPVTCALCIKKRVLMNLHSLHEYGTPKQHRLFDMSNAHCGNP